MSYLTGLLGFHRIVLMQGRVSVALLIVLGVFERKGIVQRRCIIRD